MFLKYDLFSFYRFHFSSCPDPLSLFLCIPYSVTPSFPFPLHLFTNSMLLSTSLPFSHFLHVHPSLSLSLLHFQAVCTRNHGILYQPSVKQSICESNPLSLRSLLSSTLSFSVFEKQPQHLALNNSNENQQKNERLSKSIEKL